VMALCRLGMLHEDKGNRTQAEVCFRQALTLTPEGSGPFFRLVDGDYLREDSDVLVARMEEVVANRKGRPSDRELIHFALGKHYDRTSQYSVAFDHFRCGNHLSRKRLGPFSPSALARETDARISIFTRSFLDQFAARGLDASFMVYIVGMPRSGTTLTEQILSSHTEVRGVGERPDIQKLIWALPTVIGSAHHYPTCMSYLRRGDVQCLSTQLVSDLRRLQNGATKVATKLPQDVWDLGLIQMLLPGAQLVHLRRDPVDTCLSCYMQCFSRISYATDLSDLVAVHRCYQSIVEHWRRVLPEGRFMEVDYETLVADPASTIIRLLSHLGLVYQNSCTDFHKQPRAIKTLSRCQVRQPLYTSSVARWRNYERFIEPLFVLHKENVS
jgi:hypothetical protein